MFNRIFCRMYDYHTSTRVFKANKTVLKRLGRCFAYYLKKTFQQFLHHRKCCFCLSFYSGYEIRKQEGRHKLFKALWWKTCIQLKTPKIITCIPFDGKNGVIWIFLCSNVTNKIYTHVNIRPVDKDRAKKMLRNEVPTYPIRGIF